MGHEDEELLPSLKTMCLELLQNAAELASTARLAPCQLKLQAVP